MTRLLMILLVKMSEKSAQSLGQLKKEAKYSSDKLLLQVIPEAVINCKGPQEWKLYYFKNCSLYK